jgi:hypothetical protein
LESREASQHDCRIVEMSKCETCFGSACGHNHWSHRGNMEEGDSAGKLLFGVSGIRTWRVTKSSPRGSRNAKVRNGEMNARFNEVNSMVQMNLNKIGGLLLHFIV